MAPAFLRRIRAGEAKLAWNHPATADAPTTITLSSSAFAEGAAIPLRHAGVGDNISPELTWDDVPAAAVELVLIVEDPDAPLPGPFVHCIVTGIDPRSPGIPESALGASGKGGYTLGKPYYGPAPIPGHGPHHYIFQLFALDHPSSPTAKPTKKRVLSTITDHVLARGRLTGTYER